VDISDVFRGLRALAWEERRVEAGLPTLLWSVYWNGNPWSQPPSQRSVWGKGLDLPVFDPDQHEILLYVGCTPSYDRRAQQIAHAVVAVLQAAEVRFGYLGEDEPCCGEAVLSVGHKPYFQEIINHAASVFDSAGVSTVVTISPHCYDVFKNHLPQQAGQNSILPLHYTRFFSRLLEDGRLAFDQPVEARLTFQDPCYLGRHNNEYEAPRRILESIPGVEVSEMDDHGVDALCCGGGGGRMWLETEAGERFSDLRVKQALGTGAGILATACPFCIACLEDSVKGMKLDNLRVLDIAEIAALALKP
jgi:Fe-S oxidoreductase